jgi:hypothetical protein
MILYESDGLLRDIIAEREEYMSAEEILEYIELKHPFKLEAVLGNYCSDIDFDRLKYPRKSQTLTNV